MNRLVLLVAVLMGSAAYAQSIPPLRVYDETTRLALQYRLRFQGAGVSCANNVGAGATDCTIGGASTGNWTFSANNADLSGAGAMGIGVANATSIAFGIPALTLKANSTITGASSATNTAALTLTTNVADGASSIGLKINNTTSMAAGNSLVEVQSAGTRSIGLMAGSYIYGDGAASFVRLNSGVGTQIGRGAAVLTIINDANFGAMNITTTDLSATIGDSTHRFLTLNTRHLVGGQASVPTCVAGTGAGTSGSPTCAALTHSTDLAGILEIVTKTSPAGSGATVATVTFNTTFVATPFCQFSPANAAAAGLLGTAVQTYVDYASGSATTWVVKDASATGLTANTTFDFAYQCTDSSL